MKSMGRIIGIAGLAVLTSMVLFGPPALAQEANYAEESHTLESVLEARARNTLNTILRPVDYTVSVSAQIKDDPEAVADYEKEVELRYLPGFPIPTDPSMMPANNKLHSLKQKITVHLILTDAVPKEKEKLIRDLLKAKLHMDETAGDLINLSRSDINSGEDAKPETLPELSWKMWALVVLISLLLIAGLIYYLNRRNWRRDEKDLTGDQKFAQQTQMIPPLKEEKEEEVGVPEDKTPEIDGILDLEARIERLKNEIMSVFAQYPQFASGVITDLVKDGYEEPVTLTLESLTWGVSRRLLPSVASPIWGRIGGIVRNRKTETTREELESSLKDVYRLLIARVIEKATDKDDSNPFEFIFALDPKERRQLLRQETATNVALISVFASAEQLGEMLQPLDSDKQNDVVVEISRLKNLPNAAVSASVRSLRTRLETIRTAPEYEAQGALLAANLLRSLPPEREDQLFEILVANNPIEAERVRRCRIQFLDLHVYPDDVVGIALENFDTDAVVTALFDAPAEIASKIVPLMPPKKARMVEADLGRPGLSPARSQIAAARRQITSAMEAVLAERSLTVQAVWAEIDSINPSAVAA